MHAGIIRVAEIILASYIVNVNVVRVIPIGGPRLNESEPISAVLEAGISVNHSWASDTELVRAAKIRTETRVWNSAVTHGTQVQRRLRTLPGLSLFGSLRRT